MSTLASASEAHSYLYHRWFRADLSDLSLRNAPWPVRRPHTRPAPSSGTHKRLLTATGRGLTRGPGQRTEPPRPPFGGPTGARHGRLDERTTVAVRGVETRTYATRRGAFHR